MTSRTRSVFKAFDLAFFLAGDSDELGAADGVETFWSIWRRSVTLRRVRLVSPDVGMAFADRSKVDLNFIRVYECLSSNMLRERTNVLKDLGGIVFSFLRLH